MTITPTTYDIRLGPLAFTWPTETVGETLGDTLEAVGAALTPAERRPRPLKLALRVEGSQSETDPRAVGYALRRQVRQLLENPLWLANGLYLWWRADPELSGWVRLGGGDIEETDPGVSFGIWALTLETPYLVGRPATHRQGRRLDLADRRTGLVARDTRGTIYSADFSSQALPTNPLVLPGNVVSLTASANRQIPAGSIANGPTRAGRRLYRTIGPPTGSAAIADGEVVSYLPDPAVLTVAAEAPVLLDDPGSVRAWDLTNATTYPPTQASYNTAGDADPTAYAWERVLGPMIRSSAAPLALDNGLIRLIWLGANGLGYEWYDTTLAGGTFRREGHVLPSTSTETPELTLVELTPERGIIEWRLGYQSYRAILQRGWNHVRLEAYAGGAATAQLRYFSDVGALVVATTSPSWVSTLTAGGRAQFWATGTTADVSAASSSPAGGREFSRAGAVVAQLGSPQSTAAEVASASLVDAQSVPVLLRRAS